MIKGLIFSILLATALLVFARLQRNSSLKWHK
jgi:hypothetical protein